MLATGKGKLYKGIEPLSLDNEVTKIKAVQLLPWLLKKKLDTSRVSQRDRMVKNTECWTENEAYRRDDFLYTIT